MQAFESAGIRVFALSYDEADALQDFRQAHNITFTMLSDPNSEIIRSLGILNTLIDPNDHPWYGIPYPGTYVLSSAGLVTHKFFENNLAVRAGPQQLLCAALGEPIVNEPTTTSPPDALGIEISLDGEALTPTVQKDVVVRFDVPAGRHVYAKPAPPGTLAVNVILDADERLVQRPVVRPPTATHTLRGTTEVFEVHHGSFSLRLPVTINNAARGTESLKLTGTVEWQLCDDEVCDVPAREQFELKVAIAAAPAPALGNKQGQALEPNAMQHFKHMTDRRST